MGIETGKRRAALSRRPGSTRKRMPTMLMTIAVVLLVLWLLGVFVFKITAGLIHLVLVVAIVVGLFQLFTGRRA
jgi:hypothetical protein